MHWKNLIYRIFKNVILLLPSKARALLATDIVPLKTIKGVNIKMYCNSRMTYSRFDEYWVREPETREWIDSFNNNDVFWDIGANIGVYSLWASQNPTIKVLSFEPGAFNYAVLNKNIEINHLKNITAYCMAFTKNSKLGELSVFMAESGRAGNSFSQGIGPSGQAIPVTFKQGIIGYSIDDFVGLLFAEDNLSTFPNHIKIDVDGDEEDILGGAIETLSNPRLRSIMVELYSDRPNYKNILAMLEKAGLVLRSVAHKENHYFFRS